MGLQWRERDTFQHGGVAQLGEHLLCKQGVIGSNPFISTRPAVGTTRGHEIEESVEWSRRKPAAGHRAQFGLGTVMG